MNSYLISYVLQLPVTVRPLGCFGLLFDDIEHTVLEGLLVLAESVLLPREVEYLVVKVVAEEALLEHVDEELVVGLLLELELPTVLHVLLELWRVALAKLLKRSLQLLLLYVVILLVLVPPRETLPGQTALQEVEQDMPDGLEIIPTRLLYKVLCK